jgi:hypothetical protein
VVSLGEGLYTRSQLKPGAKGRPSLIVLLTSSVALAGVRRTTHDIIVHMLVISKLISSTICFGSTRHLSAKKNTAVPC